jgi:molybdopterin molybdotransferase
MIPLADALAIVDDALGSAVLPTETVEVRGALGRVVAAHQLSRLDLPPFDKSAMDGYALPAGDDGPTYQLIESVPAGAVPTKALTTGTAIKVMTGAPVPEGTGKVVMVERTEQRDEQVLVHTPDSAINICKQGEDVRTGDVVVPAGTVLGAATIGVLISCGVTEVEVIRPVRVAVLSTGDEIVSDPADLAPGKIMNSNGPMLATLVRQHGLALASEEAVGDDRAATAEAIGRALDSSDILVMSGGVSVGDWDVVADALTDRGLTVRFDRVAVKPGKPITFACAPGKVAFGLPGNPVSAYLMFHLFVMRAARLMSGLPAEIPAESRVLAGDFKRRKAERTEYVPCRVAADGTVEPICYHGSADLRSLSTCQGLFIMPAGEASASAGQRVNVMMLTGPMT